MDHVISRPGRTISISTVKWSSYRIPVQYVCNSYALGVRDIQYISNGRLRLNFFAERSFFSLSLSLTRQSSFSIIFTTRRARAQKPKNRPKRVFETSRSKEKTNDYGYSLLRYYYVLSYNTV